MSRKLFSFWAICLLNIILSSSCSARRLKRETQPVELGIDGIKYKLNLKPTEHDVISEETLVWTVESGGESPSSESYLKVEPKIYKNKGIFFEDVENMATLLIRYQGGQIHYDGVFGEVKSLKVVKSLLDEETKKVKIGLSKDYTSFDIEEEIFAETYKENNKVVPLANKIDGPLDVMYPKLIVVVDSSLFQNLGENIADTVQYVSIFWNAVNLKYSKLTSPKIKIMVTGIIIAKDDKALSYIYESRDQKVGKRVSGLQMLSRGGKYFRKKFFRELNFNNFDSTMTMTSLRAGVGGSSFTGGICKYYENAGFVWDDGTYYALHAATHELGHLLDLPHDGTERASACTNYKDGTNSMTIMAPTTSQVEKLIWSKCSEELLREFASTKSSECLRYPYRK